MIGSKEFPVPLGAADLSAAPEGTPVVVHGAVMRIRRLSWGAFIVLRRHDGLVQCVVESGSCDGEVQHLQEESCVEIAGTVRRASMKD
ncbi:MAG TPA: OB-fold nucleic acid binding domain-containing protein, partial [Candidatus Fermentibacter sp.]|nr:OB-fold nucleic acid binding domain-containing protein [Candidatus Fermentibacter sp.]